MQPGCTSSPQQSVSPGLLYRCSPHRALQRLNFFFFLRERLLRIENLQQWAVGYPQAIGYCKNRAVPVALMRWMTGGSSAAYKVVFLVSYFYLYLRPHEVIREHDRAGDSPRIARLRGHQKKKKKSKSSICNSNENENWMINRWLSWGKAVNNLWQLGSVFFFAIGWLYGSATIKSCDGEEIAA